LNFFWRVSADTKTCGPPLYPSPAGDLRLYAGKHAGILTNFQTKVNKKMTKIALFFGHHREPAPYVIGGAGSMDPDAPDPRELGIASV